VNGLVKYKSNLLDLSAQGVAVCADGYLTVIGKTPQSADIQDLIVHGWKVKLRMTFIQILCLKFTHQQRNSKMSLVVASAFHIQASKELYFLVPS